jgi:hypothetical protein
VEKREEEIEQPVRGTDLAAGEKGEKDENGAASFRVFL